MGIFRGIFLPEANGRRIIQSWFLYKLTVCIFGHQQAPARNVFCITWISEMLLKQYCLRFGYFKDLWNYLEPKLHMELSSPCKSDALIYFPVLSPADCYDVLSYPPMSSLDCVGDRVPLTPPNIFVVLQPLRAGNFDSLWRAAHFSFPSIVLYQSCPFTPIERHNNCLCSRRPLSEEVAVPKKTAVYIYIYMHIIICIDMYIYAHLYVSIYGLFGWGLSFIPSWGHVPGLLGHLWFLDCAIHGFDESLVMPAAAVKGVSMC